MNVSFSDTLISTFLMCCVYLIIPALYFCYRIIYKLITVAYSLYILNRIEYRFDSLINMLQGENRNNLTRLRCPFIHNIHSRTNMPVPNMYVHPLNNQVNIPPVAKYEYVHGQPLIFPTAETRKPRFEQSDNFSSDVQSDYKRSCSRPELYSETELNTPVSRASNRNSMTTSITQLFSRFMNTMPNMKTIVSLISCAVIALRVFTKFSNRNNSSLNSAIDLMNGSLNVSRRNNTPPPCIQNLFNTNNKQCESVPVCTRNINNCTETPIDQPTQSNINIEQPLISESTISDALGIAKLLAVQSFASNSEPIDTLKNMFSSFGITIPDSQSKITNEHVSATNDFIKKIMPLIVGYTETNDVSNTNNVVNTNYALNDINDSSNCCTNSSTNSNCSVDYSCSNTSETISNSNSSDQMSTMSTADIIIEDEPFLSRSLD